MCDGLNALRMRATDFNLIKVSGRGDAGEVQLVRHRSTKKVYAMKLLSKYEMVRPPKIVEITHAIILVQYVNIFLQYLE